MHSAVLAWRLNEIGMLGTKAMSSKNTEINQFEMEKGLRGNKSFCALSGY